DIESTMLASGVRNFWIALWSAFGCASARSFARLPAATLCRCWTTVATWRVALAAPVRSFAPAAAISFTNGVICACVVLQIASALATNCALLGPLLPPQPARTSTPPARPAAASSFRWLRGMCEDSHLGRLGASVGIRSCRRAFPPPAAAGEARETSRSDLHARRCHLGERTFAVTSMDVHRARRVAVDDGAKAESTGLQCGQLDAVVEREAGYVHPLDPAAAQQLVELCRLEG